MTPPLNMPLGYGRGSGITLPYGRVSETGGSRVGIRVWRVELSSRRAEFDVRGRAMLADMRRRGRGHIEAVRSSRLYFFRGLLGHEHIKRLAGSLLADPVTETFHICQGMAAESGGGDACPSIEVHYRAGVMDPVAETTLRTAGRLLSAWSGADACVEQVRTGWRYAIVGARDAAELEWIAQRVLANDCIEIAYVGGYGRSDRLPADFVQAEPSAFVKRVVPLGEMDEMGLTALSRRGHLLLSLAEMKAIQGHFASLGRDPTDVELETLAQTWSEHCMHKTLRSDMVYRGADFGREGEVEIRFDDLLASTIMAATRRLDRDWCLSVFEDNAGVIAFDDDFAVAFKVETHNHPSAIEPYGGASTGMGGCIRDILGCGLGARPIAATDVFCLAAPDWPEERVPQGVLHPRRVLSGMVSGVRDYGNRMGIPTVNGAIHFDAGYLSNPLVFCGCVGLLPRDRIAKGARAGDLIVVAGGRTGRDGIHGATFSSRELTGTHAEEFSHAVQIGNAIEEKKLADAILAARDHASGCLFSAITDCGAGGLSSAVGEMGAALGVVVDLEKVPLKYAGLRYDEIWISEAQERMVLAVGELEIKTLLDVFAGEEVEATVIGAFTEDGILRLRYDGEEVGAIDMDFLHNGAPRRRLEAEWRMPEAGTGQGRAVAPVEGRQSLGERLLAELSDLNVASKEWMIRQYDHEVQGGSVIKPLVGPGGGPSDAAVLRPRLDSDRGIALGCGLCPRSADGDPYEMAVAAVDEALRNVICVGGDPQRTAILDNFCWGEVESRRALGALVRACRGAHDAAVAYGLPFISGKDSLNNRFVHGAREAARTGVPERVSIPDTLLISAISVIEDVAGCVTMDLKRPRSRLVCVGGFDDGGDLQAASDVHQRVAGWIGCGVVLSAHDVSEGGMAVAVAEMCIASGLGATINLDGFGAVFEADELLFGERRSCYVLECGDECGIEGASVVDIGLVESTGTLVIRRNGATLVALDVEAAGQAWRRPLVSIGGV